MYTKTIHTPRKVVQEIVEYFKAATLVQEEVSSCQQPREMPASQLCDGINPGLRETCLNSTFFSLETMRRSLQALTKNNSDVAQLETLFPHIQSMTGDADLCEMVLPFRLCKALEELTKELADRPKRMNPSNLRTVAQALDVLAVLFEYARQNIEVPMIPHQALSVDDEEIVRRAIMYSLKKAEMTCVVHSDPPTALDELKAAATDLILLDIEIPGMNGLELCKKIREIPAHAKIPIVFLTAQSSLQNRAQSLLMGGTDFITKPFLLSELAVKALVVPLNASITKSKSTP